MLSSYGVYQNTVVFLDWYESKINSEFCNPDIIQAIMENILIKPELLQVKRSKAYWNKGLRNRELNWIRDYNRFEEFEDVTQFELDCVESENVIPYIEGLSCKEVEVLRLFIDGFTFKEIADIWDVSKAYISKLWKAIKAKVQTLKHSMFNGFNKVENTMINAIDRGLFDE